MRNKYLSFSNNVQATPFQSTEEAWFWYCLCEQQEHTHQSHDKQHLVRPCETSDIFIAVRKLLRIGTLRPSHIKVLSKYGFGQVPPHPHFGDSLKICHLWEEALSFLDVLLKKKGIVTA